MLGPFCQASTTDEPRRETYMAKYFTALQGVAVLAACAAFNVMRASANSVIYNQDPTYNGGFSSDNDTGPMGNFFTAYDDFTLSSTSDITSVAWIRRVFQSGYEGNNYRLYPQFLRG
jgi:hypothetical protein